MTDSNCTVLFSKPTTQRHPSTHSPTANA